MANIRIKYQVDDSELVKSRKEIQRTEKEAGGLEKKIKGSGDEMEGLGKKTGGTSKAFEGLKGVVGKLGIAAAVAAGAAAMVQLAKETNKARREIATLTGVTGAALDRLTGKILATAKTFDKDYNEVLLASNALAKQFGVTQVEALDFVQEAFLSGADASGDLLETLKEYPAQVKQAGLSLDEFNELLVISAQEGVFSDKGIDAIKEAQLRLRELTPATRQALKGIDLSAKEIEKSLVDGTKSIFDVIKEVSKQLDTLPPQSEKVGAALADIFGGPGEDAGLKYISLLQDVDGELEDVSDETARYRAAQERALEAQERFNTELAKASKGVGSLAKSIGTFLKTVGADFLQWVNSYSSSAVLIEVDETVAAVAELYEWEKEALFENLKVKDDYLDKIKEISEENIKLGESVNEAREKLKQEEEDYGTVKKFVNGLFMQENEELLEARNNYAELSEQYVLNAQKIELLTKALERMEGPAGPGLAEAMKVPPEAIDELQRFSDLQAEFLTPDVQEVGRSYDKVTEIIKQKTEEQNEILRQNALDQSARQADMFADFSMDAAQIQSAFTELRQASLQEELEQIRANYAQQIELFEGNERAQQQLREAQEREERKLRTKQAERQKRSTIINIGLSILEGIARAVAQSPATGGLPGSAIVAAVGGVQLATAQATPIPQFNQGTKSVPGPDNNKDSVLALLTPRERVVKRKQSIDYAPVLDAIQDEKIRPDVINNWVMSGASGGRNIDLSSLEKRLSSIENAITRKPVGSINIDESGFTYRIADGINTIARQQGKYKM